MTPPKVGCSMRVLWLIFTAVAHCRRVIAGIAINPDVSRLVSRVPCNVHMTLFRKHNVD